MKFYNADHLDFLKFNDKFQYVLRDIKNVFIFQCDKEDCYIPNRDNIFFITYKYMLKRSPPPRAGSIDYYHLGHGCSYGDLVKIETNKWWRPVHSGTRRIPAKLYNYFYQEEDMKYYYYPILDYDIDMNNTVWFTLGTMEKSYIQKLRDDYSELQDKPRFHFKNKITGKCTCTHCKLNNKCDHCVIVKLELD